MGRQIIITFVCLNIAVMFKYVLSDRLLSKLQPRKEGVIMDQSLPVFDIPKYNNTTLGGASAVAMATAKHPLLDMRDLPYPPSALAHHKPN